MNPNRIEPVLLLLATMIVFFTVLLLGSAHYFPNDGQTFQVISGLLTGFSGAFLMRVKPTSKKDDDIAAGGSVTSVVQETTETAIPKP
jgi:cytochrome c biogenesis protein CcdA